MIHLDRVTFGYTRQKRLFENLSLYLEAGHIYGLLGKNGAGKSSLLRHMAGLLFPNSGTILVVGYEPRRRQPAFLQEVFLIPEEVYLPSVTIARYVATFAPFYPHFNEPQFKYFLSEFDVPYASQLQVTFPFTFWKVFQEKQCWVRYPEPVWKWIGVFLIFVIVGLWSVAYIRLKEKEI